MNVTIDKIDFSPLVCMVLFFFAVFFVVAGKTNPHLSRLYIKTSIRYCNTSLWKGEALKQNASERHNRPAEDTAHAISGHRGKRHFRLRFSHATDICYAQAQDRCDLLGRPKLCVQPSAVNRTSHILIQKIGRHMYVYVDIDIQKPIRCPNINPWF